MKVAIDGEPPVHFWAHYFGTQTVDALTYHHAIAVYPDREASGGKPAIGDGEELFS